MLEIYEALSRSPAWNDTLLVIVDDEHGGFYDHAPPPAVNDDSGYETLGVRVPALVVGPRVKQFVCHDVFDHTTLIKTILTRFAKNPDDAIAQMGQRVQNAQHLGVTLRDEPRTDIPDAAPVRKAIDRWKAEAQERRRAAPDGALSQAPRWCGPAAHAARVPGRVRQVRDRDARTGAAFRAALDRLSSPFSQRVPHRS